MRSQTAAYLGRQKQGEEEKERRARALNLFDNGRSVKDVASICGISRSTASRIHSCLKIKDKEKLVKLLHPLNNRRGRKTIWTKEESKALNERIITAARRGFVVDVPTLQSTLKESCADDRQGYMGSFPELL